jgi:predicted nucleic acid-binding Zn ribbon protein
MESLANILVSLYRDTPSHDEWMVAFLEGAWSGLVGEKMAQVCRPVAMRRKELTIEVLDPAWLGTLCDMKQELAKRLRNAAGSELLSVSFVLKKTD